MDGGLANFIKSTKQAVSFDGLRNCVVGAIREEYDNACTLSTTVSSESQAEIMEDAGHSIVFLNRKGCKHDHAHLAATREYERDCLTELLGIGKRGKKGKASATNGKILFVGSSSYEISTFGHLDDVAFHISEGETKDVTRTRSALIGAVKSAVNSALYSRTDEGPSKTVLASLKNSAGVADLCSRLGDLGHNLKLPSILVDRYVEAETVVMFDSIYNYSCNDLKHIFEKTGCKEIMGIQMMPMEIVFPKAVPSEHYTVRYFYFKGKLGRDGSLSGKHDWRTMTYYKSVEELEISLKKEMGKEKFSFNNVFVNITYKGYSNGYVHQYAKYVKFMGSAVETVGDFSMVMEILSWVNPMMAFRIVKGGNEIITREISLPHHRRFVRILDPEALYAACREERFGTRVNGQDVRVWDDLYISMVAQEWHEVMAWLNRTNGDTISRQGVCKFISNRMSGVILVTGSHVPMWKVKPSQIGVVSTIALAVYRLKQFMADEFEREGLDSPNMWRRFCLWLKNDTCVRNLVDWIRRMRGDMKIHEMIDVMVHIPNNEIITTEVSTFTETDVGQDIVLDFDRPSASADCDVCKMLEEYSKSKSVEHSCKPQKWDCLNYESETLTELRVTRTQLEVMANVCEEVANDARVPDELRSLNRTVLESFRRISGQNSVFVDVTYIKGGPGTGKTDVAEYFVKRNHIRPSYLAVVPFRDLAADYAARGLKVKTFAKAAISTEQVEDLVVDEFTSISLEYLFMTCVNTGAKRIFLIGDPDQCWVHRAEEGTPINRCINFNTIPCHKMLVNYRNGCDTVALVNNIFGQQYESANERVGTIVHVPFRTMPQDNETMICLSRDFVQNGADGFRPQVERVGEEPILPLTIRSVQGRTYDNVLWYVLSADEVCADNGLGLVGLTRARNLLRIACEDEIFAEIVERWPILRAPANQIVASMPKHTPVRAERVGAIDFDSIETINQYGRSERDVSNSQTRTNTVIMAEEFSSEPNASGLGSADQHWGYENSCAFLAVSKLIVELFRLRGIYPMVAHEYEGESGVEYGSIANTDCWTHTEYFQFINSKYSKNDLWWERLQIFDGKPKHWPTLLCNLLGDLAIPFVGENYDLTFKEPKSDQLVLGSIYRCGTHVEYVRRRGDLPSVLPFRQGSEYEHAVSVVAKNVIQGDQMCDNFDALAKLCMDMLVIKGIYPVKVRGEINVYPLSDVSGDSFETVQIDSMTKKQVFQYVDFRAKTRDEMWWSKRKLFCGDPKRWKKTLCKLMRLMDINFDNSQFELCERVGKSWCKTVARVCEIKGRLKYVSSKVAYDEMIRCHGWWNVKFICSLDMKTSCESNKIKNGGALCDDSETIWISKYRKDSFRERCRRFASLRKTFGLREAWKHSAIDNVVGFKGRDRADWDIADALYKEEGIEIPIPENMAKDKSAYEEHVGACYKDTDPNHVLVLEKAPEPIERTKNWFFDAYQMAPTLLCEKLFEDGDYFSLNAIGSTINEEEFRGGKLKQSFWDGLTLKGRQKNTFDQFHSACVGHGNHFSSNHPMHEVTCAGGRYLNKKEKFKFDHVGELMAKRLVDLYFDDCMDVAQCAFTRCDADEVWRRFLRDAHVKGYDKRHQDTDLNRFVGVVNFAVKDFFKPSLGKTLNEFKIAQGISAWDPALQSMYCGAFRILGDLARACEKPCVITDNGMSEHLFSASVISQMANVPDIATNAITDGVMFDSQQNEFTQEIEKQFWLKLGVNKCFLNWYYKFRKDYKVRGKHIVGYAQYEKTSGEPATKENNGIVSKVLSNAIVRGVGPFLMVYKGDDFFKRQCGQYIDEDAKTLIEHRCPLRLKVQLNASAEFCGMVAHKNCFGPSIYRRLMKLVSHRFRDYEHFSQYQDSVRNFVTNIDRLGARDVIQLNAIVYGSDIDHAECALECLISFSHINRRQFEGMFERRKEPFIIPFMKDGNVNLNIRD